MAPTTQAVQDTKQGTPQRTPQLLGNLAKAGAALKADHNNLERLEAKEVEDKKEFQALQRKANKADPTTEEEGGISLLQTPTNEAQEEAPHTSPHGTELLSEAEINAVSKDALTALYGTQKPPQDDEAKFLDQPQEFGPWLMMYQEPGAAAGGGQ